MPSIHKVASLLLLSVAVALPAAATAQDTGKGFLFGSPTGSLRIRTGWSGANAKSDLFQFATDTLSLNRRDFSSLMIGGDATVKLLGNTHLMLSIELSGMDKGSEFRHFIDNNDEPIQQTTRFRRVPVTLSIKQYVTSTGRSIGKLAWVPSRAAAYVGAGGGIQWYQFRLKGDFIDMETMDVFYDVLSSERWVPIAHAFAGVDYTLTPLLALTTEAKYSRSHGELSRDFVGFAPLDLSGFSTTLGLTVRF
jgi:hypothetical protein